MDTNHSLEAFQKGLRRVQQVEDPEQEAEVLRQLGITYSSAGDRVHAIEMYLSLKLFIFIFSLFFFTFIFSLCSPSNLILIYFFIASFHL
jgi:hypothetical protein